MTTTLWVNVDGSDDPGYRYRMPRAEVGVERRGTLLKNCGEIAKALHRPPQYLAKFCGLLLGCHSEFDEEQRAAVIRGEHLPETVHGLVRKFVDGWVLCGRCKLPETRLEVGRTKVTFDCKACGARRGASAEHKLTSFIVGNPPDEKCLGLLGSAAGDAASKSERRQERVERRAEEAREEAWIRREARVAEAEAAAAEAAAAGRPPPPGYLEAIEAADAETTGRRGAGGAGGARCLLCGYEADTPQAWEAHGQRRRRHGSCEAAEIFEVQQRRKLSAWLGGASDSTEVGRGHGTSTRVNAARSTGKGKRCTGDTGLFAVGARGVLQKKMKVSRRVRVARNGDTA